MLATHMLLLYVAGYFDRCLARLYGMLLMSWFIYIILYYAAMVAAATRHCCIASHIDYYIL
jgi:hypothetical protein